MLLTSFDIRSANHAGLDAIDHVIVVMVMTWEGAARAGQASVVVRLSVSRIGYLPVRDMMVEEDSRPNIIGMTARGQANVKDAPSRRTALMLHGINVDTLRHY